MRAFMRSRPARLAAVISALTMCASAPAGAQPTFSYAGKTLTIMVGTQVGGTADTTVRRVSDFLRKHLPGNPTVVVQNMTGAGSNMVFNYFAERAAPDGLTIAYSSYQALAQALGDPSLRARYQDFEYLGGVSDTRVGYARRDTTPGGMKSAADIARASDVLVGSYSNTDFEGTLSNLSLSVLGVRHRMVVGYRGGADIFLAMQRGEVQFHNTSLGTFRTRAAAYVKSGEGLGVYYLATVDAKGGFERNPYVTDMPAFPDLHREIRGAPPSGKNWDALNWLTSQTSELAYAAFAPRGAPPAALAALRAAFTEAYADPEFIASSVAANGFPYPFVPVARGNDIIRALANVSPDVLATLDVTMKR